MAVAQPARTPRPQPRTRAASLFAAVGVAAGVRPLLPPIRVRAVVRRGARDVPARNGQDRALPPVPAAPLLSLARACQQPPREPARGPPWIDSSRPERPERASGTAKAAAARGSSRRMRGGAHRETALQARAMTRGLGVAWRGGRRQTALIRGQTALMRRETALQARAEIRGREVLKGHGEALGYPLPPVAGCGCEGRERARRGKGRGRRGGPARPVGEAQPDLAPGRAPVPEAQDRPRQLTVAVLAPLLGPARAP